MSPIQENITAFLPYAYVIPEGNVLWYQYGCLAPTYLSQDCWLVMRSSLGDCIKCCTPSVRLSVCLSVNHIPHISFVHCIMACRRQFTLYGQVTTCTCERWNHFETKKSCHRQQKWKNRFLRRSSWKLESTPKWSSAHSITHDRIHFTSGNA